jgi:hypothetical protein
MIYMVKEVDSGCTTHLSAKLMRAAHAMEPGTVCGMGTTFENAALDCDRQLVLIRRGDPDGSAAKIVAQKIASVDRLIAARIAAGAACP